MGGWALKLFCCDWDLDLIQELDKKCGLVELEKKHGKIRTSSEGQRRQEEHRMWCAKSTGVTEEDVKRTPALKDDATPISYSVFERLCSHPEKIRAYLDSSGKLADAMAKFRQEARSASRSMLRDPYGPGYMMNILGACAMTLGAKVSVTDREAMRKYYKDCGLMRDAVKQIEAALDPETGYHNGTPWDFGSIGRDENMMRGGAPKEDLLFPGCGMTNVWVPDHGRMKGEVQLARGQVMQAIALHKPCVEDLAQTLASAFFDPYAHPRTRISSTKADSRPQDYMKLAKEMVEDYDKKKPGPPKDSTPACAGCGAKEGKNGQALKSCAKCKQEKYCSRECQKGHWKKHKDFCSMMSATLDPSANLSQMVPSLPKNE